MSTLQFKTNIKCSGCVAKSTPYLNEAVGTDNWDVDITSPDKVLTVETTHSLDADTVLQAVTKAGYQAEQLS